MDFKVFSHALHHTKICVLLTAFYYLSYTIPAYAQETIFPKSDFKELRKTGSAIVTEIIDPLTIRLNNNDVIRLTGLDIPDLNFHNPGDIALTAKKILGDFLLNQEVNIHQTVSAQAGRKNRMGHKLAHIEKNQDGTWIQGLMISLGIARVRTSKYNTELSEQMLTLEKKARDTNQGLWNMADFKMLSPQGASAKIGSYQVVEGQINKIGSNKNTLYLNFGQNWRDDFTISIDRQTQRALQKKDLNPRDWSGKTIRVRGWIESYNGPHIKLDHADHIEYLSESPAAPENKKPAEPTTKPGTGLPALND